MRSRCESTRRCFWAGCTVEWRRRDACTWPRCSRWGMTFDDGRSVSTRRGHARERRRNWCGVATGAWGNLGRASWEKRPFDDWGWGGRRKGGGYKVLGWDHARKNRSDWCGRMRLGGDWSRCCGVMRRDSRCARNVGGWILLTDRAAVTWKYETISTIKY